MKRLALISGGGAYGAWSAGLLSRLNNDYDVVAGVSTGALQAPLIALKKFDVLKEAYTNVTNESIYNVSPFKKNGKFDFVGAIGRLVKNVFKRTPTLGESLNLRKQIDKFITYKDWLELKKQNKEVIVSAVETMHEPATTCYFSSREWCFDDFKDWMWASANAPMLFSILYKGAPELGFKAGEWTDGGLTEFIPKDIVKHFDEVDVFIHRHHISHGRPLIKKNPITDPFHAAFRYFDILRTRLEKMVVDELIQDAAIAGSRINLYYMPNEVEGNSLAFDKQTMQKWYQIGATQEPIKISFDFSNQI